MSGNLWTLLREMPPKTEFQYALSFTRQCHIILKEYMYPKIIFKNVNFIDFYCQRATAESEMRSRKTRRKIRPTRCFVAYTVLLFSGRFLWACGIYFQYIHSEARNMWAEERKEIFNDVRKFSEENIFMYKDIQFCCMYRYYVPMSPYCRMNLLRCK